eukprot:g4802.t1
MEAITSTLKTQNITSGHGIALDGAGNVIVADQGSHRISKVTKDGTVTTLAGSGSASYQDGQGASAHFRNPCDVAVDADGNVIVADCGNHRIRKVTKDGTVTTLAGSGSQGHQDGQGASAHFRNPCDVAVDADGNVIVADGGNHRIRKVTKDGTVTTLAGSGASGCEDGNGECASFSSPSGITVSNFGRIYVRDGSSIRVLEMAHVVPPSAVISDMSKLFETASESNMSDVEFDVDGTRIKAHRNIIAFRCEVFSKMFASSCKESTGKVVEIKDTTPEAFRAFLLYLYADKLDFADGIVIDVLRLAKMYRVLRLRIHCVRHCQQDVDAGNAMTWLVETHRHHLTALFDIIRRWTVCNFRDIVKTNPESLHVLKEFPDLMVEVTTASISMGQ